VLVRPPSQLKVRPTSAQSGLLNDLLAKDTGLVSAANYEMTRCGLYRFMFVVVKGQQQERCFSRHGKRSA
jgi:hypothetical protein